MPSNHTVTFALILCNSQLKRMLRFNFKSRDPKFRIETPSRVIHVLKTPVSEETSACQKLLIRRAVMRCVHRYGTSPPQDVGVGFTPTSQTNYVVTISCTTVLGTAAYHPTGGTTLFSCHAPGLLPSRCARPCSFIHVSLTW